MRYCLVDIKYWERFVKQFKEKEIPEHIKEYNVLILTGWLYGISSIIEESFRLILRKLKPGACNDATASFESIYGCLFKELSLQGYIGLFDLYRLVRNCIHTNGIFFPPKQTDRRIIHKGITYDFVVGKKLKFVNFHFINDITKDILSVLMIMIKSSRVSSIAAIPRLR